MILNQDDNYYQCQQCQKNIHRLEYEDHMNKKHKLPGRQYIFCYRCQKLYIYSDKFNRKHVGLLHQTKMHKFILPNQPNYSKSERDKQINKLLNLIL